MRHILEKCKQQLIAATQSKTKTILATLLMLPVGVTHAAQTIGAIKKLQDIVCEYQTFMSGTAGPAMMIASIILAVGAWQLMPRESFVGTAVRIVVAGVVIVNATTLITNFGGTAPTCGS